MMLKLLNSMIILILIFSCNTEKSLNRKEIEGTYINNNDINDVIKIYGNGTYEHKYHLNSKIVIEKYRYQYFPSSDNNVINFDSFNYLANQEFFGWDALVKKHRIINSKITLYYGASIEYTKGSLW